MTLLDFAGLAGANNLTSEDFDPPLCLVCPSHLHSPRSHSTPSRRTSSLDGAKYLTGSHDAHEQRERRQQLYDEDDSSTECADWIVDASD